MIGHIGRFMKQKNHEFLIDIFSEIHKCDKITCLVLVGNGELQEQIKDRVKEKGLQDCVIFAGVRADIPQLLSAMDVFLFPSLYEGMPNTVIEAQATGLPCVISDSITREADITGTVQYVSLNESDSVWAEKVLEITNSGIKRHDMTECFKKNRYDIESVTEDFVKLIFD